MLLLIIIMLPWEMAQINKRSKWLKELQRYMEAYNISQEDLEQNNHANIVENQVERRERDRDRVGKHMESNSRLKHFEQKRESSPADYLNNSKASKRFCKARMEDLYSITREENLEKCNLCNEQVKCLLNHIIKDCTLICNKREALKDKAWEDEREWNKTWTCDSLKETSNRIAHTLGELIEEWVTKTTIPP